MRQLFIPVLLLCFWSSAGQGAETLYQLQVNGLVCPFCEFNVEKKLSKLDGVLKVDVNLNDGVVNVLVADGKKLSEAELRQEITDAGFTLESIEILSGGPVP